MILENLIKAINRVTTEQVDHPDLGIQERVFCYELYHQLRIMEEEGEIDIRPARIQGDLNKAGQAFFGEHEPQPDLLFHEPGRNRHNLCVVEVKSAKERNIRRYKTDLWKLSRFINEPVEYTEIILLIVGHGQEIERASRFINELKTEEGTPIDVILYEIDREIKIMKINYDERAGP